MLDGEHVRFGNSGSSDVGQIQSQRTKGCVGSIFAVGRDTTALFPSKRSSHFLDCFWRLPAELTLLGGAHYRDGPPDKQLLQLKYNAAREAGRRYAIIAGRRTPTKCGLSENLSP